MRCENDMSTSSTSSIVFPRAVSTPTYGNDVHLTPSNSDSFSQVRRLGEDEPFTDLGAIQESTDSVDCAAGSSCAAVTASLEGFLQVSEEETHLWVVWVRAVVISVELAISVVVAFSFAVQLLRDIGKKFNDILSEDTLHVVSTRTTPQVLSDAVLAFV